MSIDAIKADPAWRLDRFDRNGAASVFVRAPRDRIAQTPFLDRRWRTPDDEAVAIETRALDGAVDNVPTPAFIWHSAFCCSTLLAGLLDKPGAALPVREPDVLMTVANVKRNQGGEAARRLLDPVLKHVARGYTPGERAVIKPTNLANAIMGDCLAVRSDAKAILLTSSLEAFLVSIAKKGEAGRAFARLMYTIFAMDGRAPNLSELELMRASDLQIAALVWHMQIAEMNAAARSAPGRTAWLDGDAFLAAPEDTLNRIDVFFGLGLGADFAKQAASGPAMTRNAKSGEAYGAGDRASETERVRAALGEDLPRIAEWSRQVFPDTPRGDPVSPALAAA